MNDYGLQKTEFVDMEVAFRINLYRGHTNAQNVSDSRNGVNDTENGVGGIKNGVGGIKNGVDDTENGVDGVKNGVNDTENGIEMVLNKVTAQEQKLLNILAENPTSTQSQCASQLGVSKRVVSQRFVSLQNKKKSKLDNYEETGQSV